MAPRTGRGAPPPAPLAAIVGPTASGKSELALALAPLLPAELLVADSRQVYRGLEIGTAKPTGPQRAGVPHHLLDLVDPDQPFTVADWVAAARAVLPGIAERGAVPLLVGGTGLYVSALVEGYDFNAEAFSPAIRTALTARLEHEGLEPLATELAARHPGVAARTDLRNPRRVLRALERTLAGDAGGQPSGRPYPGRLALLGISRPRAELYRRIDARAERLFASGLVDEVRGLLETGYAPELPPLTGIGYREAAGVAMREWSVEAAIAATARRTRQYAKRQLSWFRRDQRIAWIAAGDTPGDDPVLVARATDLIRRLIA